MIQGLDKVVRAAKDNQSIARYVYLLEMSSKVCSFILFKFSPQAVGHPIVQYRQLGALPGVFQVILFAWERLDKTSSKMSRHC